MDLFRDSGEYAYIPFPPSIHFDNGFVLYITDEEYTEFEKLFDDEENVSEEELFQATKVLAEKHGRSKMSDCVSDGEATCVDSISPRE